MDAFFTTLSGRLDLLTWTGLGLFLVLAVTLGWFVPRRTHDRMLKIQAEAHQTMLRIQAEAHAIVVQGLTARNVEVVADKVENREGSKAWEAAASELLSQNRTMLEQGETTVHALEEMRSSLVVLANRDVTQ